MVDVKWLKNKITHYKYLLSTRPLGTWSEICSVLSPLNQGQGMERERLLYSLRGNDTKFNKNVPTLEPYGGTSGRDASSFVILSIYRGTSIQLPSRTMSAWFIAVKRSCISFVFSFALHFVQFAKHSADLNQIHIKMFEDNSWHGTFNETIALPNTWFINRYCLTLMNIHIVI